MSYQNGPQIVTSGLVFCIDAGNSKSYSGSGSSWTDLSISRNTTTLSGSPTYSSNNKGYLSFASASSQYGTASSPGDLSTWTVETFVRFTSSYSTKVATIVTGQYNGSNKLNFSIGTNNAPTNYNIAVGFFDGSWHNTTGIAYALNTWFHIVGTYDGTTIKQFTNGSQVDSLTYTGTPSSGGELRINRRWDDVVSASNLFDSNIAVIRIYNRALSGTEITQNYRSIKGRYSL
jgi:hypothetical protein